MMYELEPSGDAERPEASLPRVFLRESGWRVGLKVGSEKVYCYQMAPGEDAYHRLLDGEIYLHHGDEKLCLPCAERRGLIVFSPRVLRDKTAGLDVSAPTEGSEYEVR